MFSGKKVKIRLKRLFHEQRVRVFVGTVLEMNDAWIRARGKNYYLAKGEAKPHIDERERIVGIPRENIYALREFPDDLDLDNLTFELKDMRMVIRVPGGQAASISE
jgi:hypothetical protein